MPAARDELQGWWVMVEDFATKQGMICSGTGFPPACAYDSLDRGVDAAWVESRAELCDAGTVVDEDFKARLDSCPLFGIDHSNIGIDKEYRRFSLQSFHGDVCWILAECSVVVQVMGIPLSKSENLQPESLYLMPIFIRCILIYYNPTSDDLVVSIANKNRHIALN